MDNGSNLPNAIAATTFEAAEALSALVSLGQGKQYHPPRTTSIMAGLDQTEIHSIFHPGRLRGTMHYEASSETVAQDNLAKFVKAINDDPARANLVRSVALHPVYDHFRHSGVIELFNQEVLPAYAFTDDSSGGPFPPLTGAALYLKGVQQRMANHPFPARHPTCPTDHTLLNKNFLLTHNRIADMVAIYVELLITLCPRLQIIYLPVQWCSTHGISFDPRSLHKWKEFHNFDLEVKEIFQGAYMRLGKKGGWSDAHVQRWMGQIVEDIVKNG